MDVQHDITQTTRSIRHRTAGRVVLLAGAVAVGGLSLPAPAFALASTGNAKAIAFYRTAVSATNDLSHYVQNQTGFVRITSSVGKVDTSSWDWGWAQYRAGYYPTKERIEFAQSAGKVLWIEDTLRPIVPPCHAALCNAVYPIQFFITTKGDFEGIVVSGPTASCFNREAAKYMPYRAGGHWWITEGFFYPMAVHGSQTAITSKYPNAGQQVTETDWIANATKLFTKSVIHVATAAGHRGYNYSDTDVKLTSRPIPPKIKIC